MMSVFFSRRIYVIVLDRLGMDVSTGNLLQKFRTTRQKAFVLLVLNAVIKFLDNKRAGMYNIININDSFVPFMFHSFPTWRTSKMV